MPSIFLLSFAAIFASHCSISRGRRLYATFRHAIPSPAPAMVPPAMPPFHFRQRLLRCAPPRFCLMLPLLHYAAPILFQRWRFILNADAMRYSAAFSAYFAAICRHFAFAISPPRALMDAASFISIYAMPPPRFAPLLDATRHISSLRR